MPVLLVKGQPVLIVRITHVTPSGHRRAHYGVLVGAWCNRPDVVCLTIAHIKIVREPGAAPVFVSRFWYQHPLFLVIPSCDDELIVFEWVPIAIFGEGVQLDGVIVRVY